MIGIACCENCRNYDEKNHRCITRGWELGLENDNESPKLFCCTKFKFGQERVKRKEEKNDL